MDTVPQLKPEDVAEAVVYVLSTAPAVHVSNQTNIDVIWFLIHFFFYYTNLSSKYVLLS